LCGVTITFGILEGAGPEDKEGLSGAITPRVIAANEGRLKAKMLRVIAAKEGRRAGY
jgi:hypothetical protein